MGREGRKGGEEGEGGGGRGIWDLMNSSREEIHLKAMNKRNWRKKINLSGLTSN